MRVDASKALVDRLFKNKTNSDKFGVDDNDDDDDDKEEADVRLSPCDSFISEAQRRVMICGAGKAVVFIPLTLFLELKMSCCRLLFAHASKTIERTRNADSQIVCKGPSASSTTPLAATPSRLFALDLCKATNSLADLRAMFFTVSA
jgi:hypothetical protein